VPASGALIRRGAAAVEVAPIASLRPKVDESKAASVAAVYDRRIRLKISALIERRYSKTVHKSALLRLAHSSIGSVRGLDHARLPQPIRFPSE
jgi:hypothetical protein